MSSSSSTINTLLTSYLNIPDQLSNSPWDFNIHKYHINITSNLYSTINQQKQKQKQKQQHSNNAGTTTSVTVATREPDDNDINESLLLLQGLDDFGIEEMNSAREMMNRYFIIPFPFLTSHLFPILQSFFNPSQQQQQQPTSSSSSSSSLLSTLTTLITIFQSSLFKDLPLCIPLAELYSYFLITNWFFIRGCGRSGGEGKRMIPESLKEIEGGKGWREFLRVLKGGSGGRIGEGGDQNGMDEDEDLDLEDLNPYSKMNIEDSNEGSKKEFEEFKSKLSEEFVRSQLRRINEGKKKMGEDGGEFEGDDDDEEEDSVNVSSIGWDLINGGKVWEIWKVWEEEVLVLEGASPERIQNLQQMYLSRLEIPHSSLSQTFTSYSTFVTSHLPPQSYEQTMIRANGLYSSSLQGWREREDREEGVERALREVEGGEGEGEGKGKGKKTEAQLQAELKASSLLLDYISSEEHLLFSPQTQTKKGRKKRGGGEGVVGDDGDRKRYGIELIGGLFERWLERWGMEIDVLGHDDDDGGGDGNGEREGEGEGQGDAERTIRTELKRKSKKVWEDYLGVLMMQSQQQSQSQSSSSSFKPLLLSLIKRATRYQPHNGDIWAAYLRIGEEVGMEVQEVVGIFEMATQPGLLDRKNGDENGNGGVDDLVKVYQAMADYYRRMGDLLVKAGAGLDPDLIGNVMGTLISGIERVKSVSKQGDPQLRLEKYLLSLYERYEQIDEAVKLWESLTKQYRQISMVWIQAAEFFTRHNLLSLARQTYKSGCTTGPGGMLDFPEYLYDSWIEFEHRYGDLKELEFALGKVRRGMKGVERRRVKEYEEAYLAQMQQQQAQTHPPTQESSSAIAAPMEIDSNSTIVTPLNGGSNASNAVSSKRKLEAIVEGEEENEKGGQGSGAGGGEKGNKKPKTDHTPQEPKRDREHSSVFLSQLGKGVSEQSIRGCFRDCGPMREIKIHEVGGNTVATVEFENKDDVLAARTKDKKFIEGHQIEVGFAWQSTLYVTNFPDSADDEWIRKTFGAYGDLFEVRWPSKRFKNTRRFVYVQYIRESDAQSACILNGHSVAPGQNLYVHVSAPERKKQRTDAGANDREVYVGGMSKFTREAELKKLFAQYGNIAEIRMALDNEGNSKGWAFIDFDEETSAKAALSLNNYELKKRRISVTIADSRQAKQKGPNRQERRAAARNRTVRITNLATDTQEALIQQAFEKYGKVKAVKFQQGETEGTIEFENEADLGKVILNQDSFQINGQKVILVPENVATLSKQRADTGRSISPSVSVSSSTAPTTQDRTKPPGAKGSSSSTTSTSQGGFMPRTVASRARGKIGPATGRGRGRPGLGAGRGNTGANTGGGNDDFRKMLDG